MDNKEYPDVRKEAIRQGWLVVPTRLGERFLGPDGITTANWHRAHASLSPRALDWLVRDLRKGGFVWPPERGTRR